jgi:hypothetical protein
MVPGASGDSGCVGCRGGCAGSGNGDTGTAAQLHTGLKSFQILLKHMLWRTSHPCLHQWARTTSQQLQQWHPPSAGTSTVRPPPDRFHTRPAGVTFKLPWFCSRQKTTDSPLWLSALACWLAAAQAAQTQRLRVSPPLTAPPRLPSRMLLKSCSAAIAPTLPYPRKRVRVPVLASLGGFDQ